MVQAHHSECYIVLLHVTVRLFFRPSHSWSCVTITSGTHSTHTLTKTCLNSLLLTAPTQSRSHHTNLAFFLREEGFARLLLAWLLWGRSLKRLSLVCGNGMAEPNLLTTTSSLPPISTPLTESRNYSPAQNLALSSPGSWRACECVVSPLHLLCVVRGSDVVGLCWSSGAVWLRVCELSGAAAGMQRGVTQHIIHTCPLPRHYQVTRHPPPFHFKQECPKLVLEKEKKSLPAKDNDSPCFCLV